VARSPWTASSKPYYAFTRTNTTNHPEPLGYLGPEEVPVSHFLATEYAVCDRWFAPLPASTQPNRLMALTGSTRVDHTEGVLPPESGKMVLDWLTEHGVRWRVYHAGLSFFLLLGRFDLALGSNFRSIERLAHDVLTEARESFPQVIFIEPSYGDAPHLGADQPNDNHPPLPVAFGELLLRDIYLALSGSPERFARMAWFVTFDEHGGFYDHVPPLDVPFVAPEGATFTEGFKTTGVRVPAIVVSPLVERGAVCHASLDHTSLLQLFATQFGDPGESYSPDVDARRSDGIENASTALTRETPRTTPTGCPSVALAPAATPAGAKTTLTPNEQAFVAAARRAMSEHPEATREKHPELRELLSRTVA
jgi:phospholipase C